MLIDFKFYLKVQSSKSENKPILASFQVTGEYVHIGYFYLHSCTPDLVMQREIKTESVGSFGKRRSLVPHCLSGDCLSEIYVM